MPAVGADDARRERARQAILAAFSDVVRPADGRIARTPETFEGEEAERDFKGHHWQEVPREIVRRHTLVFFCPEARRFYMPAFLLAALDVIPGEAAALTIYTLEPPDDAERFQQEYAGLTYAQREAVRLFLDYAHDEASSPGIRGSARRALSRYWAHAPVSEAQGLSRDPAEPAPTARVKERIREAFAEVHPPPVEAITRDPEDWEAKDIGLDFVGYRWRELPLAVVSYHYAALSFLSAEGLRAYLPAYLFAALDGDGMILDRVLAELAPKQGDGEDFARRFAAFTRRQREAILEFFSFVIEEMPAEGSDARAREALAAWEPPGG